ncbi:hypothetical protein [Photobacterium leiognathi]|uniref:hypothetical protein n=1 Tax=Photobacterium leiognathi TaxID=553611 RepID=UPI002980B64F|nr:hypothetical protein [Photobacterium leiognathi]
MSVATKKEVTKSIGFYRLRVKKLRTPVDNPVYMDINKFKETLIYIDQLNDQQRLYDIENTSGRKKFHFLKSLKDCNNNCYELIFSSAKYEYRPPVIDKQTLKTKENPRTMTEGDEELTHVKIYLKQDHADILIEERINGITSRGISDYLNSFKHIQITEQKIAYEKLSLEQKTLIGPMPVNNFRFSISYIANDDFQKALLDATKICAGHIYIEKELIKGSEFARYSNKLSTYTNDLEITLKSSDDILDILSDYYEEHSSGVSQINRIKVEIQDELGKQSIIDTERFKLKKTIEVETNIIDGVIISTEMFSEMSKLL